MTDDDDDYEVDCFEELVERWSRPGALDAVSPRSVAEDLSLAIRTAQVLRRELTSLREAHDHLLHITDPSRKGPGRRVIEVGHGAAHPTIADGIDAARSFDVIEMDPE